MKVKIVRHPGSIYTLYSKHKVNSSLKETWDFFSQAKNLNKLTPSDMNFKINSGESDDFYQGKIISYKISLFFFLKFNWTTEITKVNDQVCFIDKQLFGPYKLWHHEHYFTDNNDGTITITDKVKYKLYFAPFSRIIHKLFIRRKLLEIFTFRSKMISKILN